jgi:hypothetical protein
MKSNKLIAEFMGVPTEVFTSGKLNYFFRSFNSGTWYEEQELSYNISWDWLMPVVLRLLDLEYNEFDGADDLSFRLNDTLLETNLDSLYRIVVEFINEYNKTM